MKVDSTYSVSFYSDSLNDVKYNHLLDKANFILEFKNFMSKEICKNYLEFQQLSRFDFFKKYNCQIEGLVGREIQPTLTDVYTAYQNRLDQYKRTLSFWVQNKIETSYYKKATKKNKKGDVKDFRVILKQTKLTKVLSFMTKYYNETTVEYMIGEISNPKTEKTASQIELYKSVLFYIDKFGDRLLKLVYLKRDIMYKKVFGNPILFKKPTYDAINRSQIISESKNKNSSITHFITLTGFNGITESGKLDIPVKYDKKYHGDINLFNKAQTAYTVQFVKDKIRIILTKEGERDYKDDGNNILGADVNVKHNLFSLSNGETIDFDRDLIKNFVKTMLKFDKKHKFLYKTNDEELTEDELKQKNNILKRIETWLRRLAYHYNFKAHELIEMAKKGCFDHIAVEDLNLLDDCFGKSEEFFNIKYSRLIRMLHLSNFKNILTNQCVSKGLQLTFVPSPYTSQRCHKCGFVDRHNREIQEIFHCINCDYECNADYNASQNIKQIAELDVLISLLLKKESNGWFVPKTNNRFTIRKILDDCFEKHSCKASKDVGVNV